MLKGIIYACLAAGLALEAAAQDPEAAAARAAKANAYHLQRRLDEASDQYRELLNIEPAATPSATQRAAILRFAPRVFQVSGDPFGLKDVVAIHHPNAPMIAYHFFWDDDIDFPEDNDPCDHELVWVRYDPNTMNVVSFHTYFHERILSSPEAILDAAKNGQRPRVNVQWGKHGSLPYGWDKLVPILDDNMATYRKLHTEGRRLPDHPLGRNWPRRFEGTWSDFIAFNKEIDIRSVLKKKEFMAVSRWNNAVINQRFIAYNFRPKTEWPEQPTTAETAQVRTRPGIIAHRGVMLAAPENTIPAIEQAVALGSSAAEIDLRYTADGEVVLLHDETLDRTTNGHGRVAEKTLAEVKKLDAGSWFDSKFSGTRVPTFREVIEMARGRIALYLDLKEADPTPVIRMVAQLNASDFVYFRPYSYTALRKIVGADRNNKVLFDLDDWMQMPELLQTVRLNFPNVWFSGSLHVWTPEMLEQARQLGVQTFVNVLGPEDTRQNLERAVRMGFDFIQTDHETELRDLLQQPVQGRVLLDAHNCYPDGELWKDRIDRALFTGTPLAIEQDLVWYVDHGTGHSWSVLSHSASPTGSEPTMKDYFFERIRPIVERALKTGDRRDWPLITLNLDLKTEEPEHLKAIWNLLAEYREWITTAPRASDIHRIAPLNIRPLLVLTGESNAQKAVFYDQVPIGDRLLVFGATPNQNDDPSAPPSILAPEPADNYHRWWNNPWRVVEPEGQTAAGDWSAQDEKRLNDLVRYAHQRGFWIRFYTLDGESPAVESSHGWTHSYNFGSIDAARLRWRAAIAAGADFIAVDQYEEFANELHGISDSR